MTYDQLMYCRGCQYDLNQLPDGRCPECGRSFDPTKPRTVQRRRRRLQPLVGLGFALAVGLAVIVGFRAAYMPDYGYSRFAALGTVAGIGLLGGLASGMLAAWNRSWWGRVPLLFTGVLCTWAGLAFGTDKYFRVWQSMPNAPDEAYSDAGAMVPLFVGWIPGGLFVGGVFALTLLGLVLHCRTPKSSAASNPRNESPSGNRS